MPTTITQIPDAPFDMQYQSKSKTLTVHVTQINANGLATATVTDVQNMPQYKVGDVADNWNPRAFTRII